MRRAGGHSAQPVRTCVGCRQRDRQGALLRFAVIDGQPTVDPRRRLPGRGAYLHADNQSKCIMRAARGALARALRVSVGHVDEAELQLAVARAAAQTGGETCQAEVQAR